MCIIFIIIFFYRILLFTLTIRRMGLMKTMMANTMKWEVQHLKATKKRAVCFIWISYDIRQMLTVNHPRIQRCMTLNYNPRMSRCFTKFKFLSYKNGTRKSLSFSNERMREIERTNRILLKKILSKGPTQRRQLAGATLQVGLNCMVLFSNNDYLYLFYSRATVKADLGCPVRQ